MSVSNDIEDVDSVRVAADSGRVRVVAGDHDFRVDGEADVHIDGRQATVETTERVTVYVPEGTDIVVGTSSGRVAIEGIAGAVAVASESGSVTIDHASSVDARTTSGRVKIGCCDGECRVTSSSARVTVEHCGAADVSTTSGRIDVRDADGLVRAHCVSGRIDIEMDGAHDADAETVSGRVQITYPAGVRFRQADDGDADDPPHGETCTVRARSVSGRVSVSNR